MWDQTPRVLLARCCAKASWSSLDEANTKGPSSQWDKRSKCQLRWRLEVDTRFLIILKGDVTVNQKSAKISNQRSTECFCFYLFQKAHQEPRWRLAFLFQHWLLCIYPLNYWAKKMVPVMVAWPECCQSAVPSQPFSELFLISRAQSDSQRQMVFKQNGCGRKSGSWLNQPWKRLGTAKAGLQHPDSLPLDGRSKREPVVPQLSAILISTRLPQSSQE